MTMSELQERLHSSLPQMSNLGAVVKFDLGADGQWLVDARSAPCIAEDELEPDCTVALSAENLLKLLDGRLDPMLAYTLGKIKVRGSMGVAMKLVAAIG